MTRTPERVEDYISSYIKELSEWGRRMNLVGSTDDDALRLHLCQKKSAV